MVSGYRRDSVIVVTVSDQKNGSAASVLSAGEDLG
jgi:hypothetical protein